MKTRTYKNVNFVWKWIKIIYRTSTLSRLE